MTRSIPVTLALALGATAACGGPPPPGRVVSPPLATGSAAPASSDECDAYADKLLAVLQRAVPERALGEADRTKAAAALALDCRADPNDAVTAAFVHCVAAARRDAEALACQAPAETIRDAPVQLLTRLGRSAKVYFALHEAFPKGTSALQPAQPCCHGAAQLCPAVPAPAMRADPMWDALGFTLGVPGRFQYHYEGDGTQATATAVGDPACDGHPVTYTLHLTSPDGNPTGKIDGPPSP